MKNKGKVLMCVFWVLFLAVFPWCSAAQSGEGGENDIKLHGIELNDIITVGSSLLASGLFIFTLIAYRRDGRRKLFYVSVAFFLFAVKGFLLSSGIIFPTKPSWIDPTANFLDFVVLLCFFLGITKK
jgi:hypothetical protein